VALRLPRRTCDLPHERGNAASHVRLATWMTQARSPQPWNAAPTNQVAFWVTGNPFQLTANALPVTGNAFPKAGHAN